MINRILIFLIALLLLACDNEDLLISVGDNLIKSQTSISLIDSISVQMSTFRIDSINTSGTGLALSGKYFDSECGMVSAEAYFQLNMPNNTVEEEELFDSIIIKIPYSGISYGDTLAYQSFYLHRVLEDIEPKDGELYLYNTTYLKYDASPLGGIKIRPRPNFHNELEIRLSDELGLDFMRILKDDDNQFNNTEDFLEYMKGFVLVSGEENTALLSFKTDSTLKIELHTHLIEEERTERIYSFPFASTLQQFNHIKCDSKGFSLEKVTSQGLEVKSVDLDNKAYLQAGGALVTRVDFPGIKKILEEERYNILYKAELILRPVPGTYKSNPLPPYLVLYTTDKYNNLVAEITTDDDESIYADFYYDEFYNENNYYQFDVTDFIYSELSDGFVDPNNGLLIMMKAQEFQASLNRVVFDARNESKFRPMLKLYYVFYE